MTANFLYHGIFSNDEGVKEVSGNGFYVDFTIVDTVASSKLKYNVTISVNGFQSFFKSYNQPGRYSAYLAVPKDVKSAIVTLWMENSAHQIFTHFFPVTFNIRFYRLLKYVLFLPLILIVLSLVKLETEQLLPTTSSSTRRR